MVYFVNMKTYGQYCALAKALDLVGDRWTLLIIRELLIRDGSRYTDLRAGLPGIATNLLVNRLRELEQAGLVTREDAPPPVATTLFHLTPRGKELEAAVYQLGRWGAPLLADTPKKALFRTHWLALPARHWLKDHTPDRPSVTMELRAAGESIAIETVDGSIRTHAGPARPSGRSDHGEPTRPCIPSGRKTKSPPSSCGRPHTFEGDIETLRRFQPLATCPLLLRPRSENNSP